MMALTMKARCYLCGSTNVKVRRRKLRHDAKRIVYECHRCDLVFLDEEKRDLQKYYASQEYRKVYSPVIGKPARAKDIYDVYAPVMKSRLERVKKYLGKNKRILEVGCSAGHFLKTIKPHVGEMVGLEFNLENATYVRKHLGIDVYTEPIEKTDLPKKHFDVIFCFHTLEHMKDPLQFLKSIKPYLKEGGMVYIEVPNLDEGTLSLYHNTAYEDFYYREVHLFYFTPKTLMQLFRKAGYTGKVLPFQWYSFVNQMHWLLANAPQKSGYDGIKDPELVTATDVPAPVRKTFNTWIQKVDKEYRALLEKHMRSDQIVFVGKPK